MSTAILPSLIGLGFDITRTPVWDTTVQQAISGKETRIARLTYPRWKWELAYNVLRSNSSFSELQQLAGFFNARQGMFDTFLYQDADDHTVTAQALGTGDGATVTFPLARSFGGFIEPMLAPNLVSAVYLNGVAQADSAYTISTWGAANPGIVTFIAAPASGVTVTADFSFFWPCRMSVDNVDFSLFLSGYYKTKKFSFISVKN